MFGVYQMDDNLLVQSTLKNSVSGKLCFITANMKHRIYCADVAKGSGEKWEDLLKFPSLRALRRIGRADCSDMRYSLTGRRSRCLEVEGFQRPASPCTTPLREKRQLRPLQFPRPVYRTECRGEESALIFRLLIAIFQEQRRE